MPKATRYSTSKRKASSSSRTYQPYSRAYKQQTQMSVVPTRVLMANRPEVGTVDVNHGVKTIAADQIGTNAGVFLINPVQPGTGIQNRARNDIKALSIAVRGYCNSQLATNAVVGDIYIVYDKSPQSTLPTYQTMFQGIDQAGTAINIQTAYMNPNQNRRFIVISHETFECDITGGSTNLQTDQAVDMYRKTGLSTTFSGTANPLTVSSISVGAYYLVINCRDELSTVAGANGFRVNLFTRFRFIG